MKEQCIACGFDAKVTLILEEKNDYGVLGTVAPKSFCLFCMNEISKAYNNLYNNNFAGISLDGGQSE
jgi:hypothetical protein